MEEFIGKKVLVRSYEAGVYYGKLKSKNGNEVVLTDARNIWRWEGANCIADIVNDGVANSSRISQFVDEFGILNVCEIIPLTEKAITNLDSIDAWKYQ